MSRSRLGGRLGVSLDMKVGGPQTLPQPARLGVDPHHFGVGEEIATLGSVMAEPGAGGDHQIAFGKQLAAEIGGEGAGDIERERVAFEQALAEQSRRQQGARLFGSETEGTSGANVRSSERESAPKHKSLSDGIRLPIA